MILAFELQATLLGVAAIVSATGGAIATILSIRKSKDEEKENCLKRLKEARAEAESLAQELHEERMKRTWSDYEN